QREGVWEAIWAELHMALRDRMGREVSPSAAVLDNQSVKSAEKGASETTRWAMTPARGEGPQNPRAGRQRTVADAGIRAFRRHSSPRRGRLRARKDPPLLPVARTDLGRWRLQRVAG